MFNARVATALVFLGWVRAAEAACPPGGIQIFPAPGSTVPTNSKLILEGVGSAEATVSALVGATLHLVSDLDSVPLKVAPGWKSADKRAAVILRPARSLKPDLDYELQTRNTPL